jgi:hypothetical protein
MCWNVLLVKRTAYHALLAGFAERCKENLQVAFFANPSNMSKLHLTLWWQNCASSSPTLEILVGAPSM